MLAFKGILFQRAYAPYHYRREFRRLSGQGYVPSLFQDGRTFPWHAIPDPLKGLPPPLVPIPGGKSASSVPWGPVLARAREVRRRPPEPPI